MVQYLIPGAPSESVRGHLDGRVIGWSEDITISSPRQVTGYMIPESEIMCSEFLGCIGIGMIDPSQSQTTNLRGVRLLNLEQPPQIFRATYDQDSERVRALLVELAQEFRTNITATSVSDTCFGREPDCGECYLQIQNESEWSPRRSDGLHIDFRCRNAPRSEARLQKIYDVVLGSSHTARLVASRPVLPSRGGAVVYDTNATPVAEIMGREITILVNVDPEYEGYSWAQMNYWSRNGEVLGKILRDAIPIALAQPAQAEHERRLERIRSNLSAGQAEAVRMFLESGSRSVEDRKRRVREQIEGDERKSRQWLSEYVGAQNNLARSIAELAILEADGGSRASLATELEHVLAMPHVIGIKFRNCLEVYTDTIYIAHGRVKYNIGAFKIMIDFQRGYVKFENLTNPNLGVSEHPHISGGNPCFGNISEAVARMMGSEQLEMLVTVLIQFLESYDSQSPYSRIENWPVVD